VTAPSAYPLFPFQALATHHIHINESSTSSSIEAMAPSSIPTTTPSAEIRAANRHRFEFELEFVQSLANPHYLQSLAQQNILSQPSFVLYLDYLQYWTGPEYARFVV
jgi:SOH1